MERLVLKQRLHKAGFSRNLEAENFNLEIIRVQPRVSPSGNVYRYSAHDLENIRSRNLHLLVRGGSGILRGDVLTVCPGGVVSFHHGDNNQFRGGPPGFWEVAERVPRTGFVIQRLNEELDGGDVLFKGFVTTSWLYTLNLARLYQASNPFMHQVLEDLASANPSLQIADKEPYAYRLCTLPTIGQQLGYVLRTVVHVIRKVSRRAVSRQDIWNVAYQFTDSWRDVTLWRSSVIPNPKGRYLADPFLVYRNGKHYAFVEDYSLKDLRGHISVYEIGRHGTQELGAALVENFHLSYPSLFDFEGDLYMCPDTNKADEIRIYRAIDFPLQWELCKVAMRNVSAVDTNIFWREGLWWLFTNIATDPANDHNSELHIFYGNSPLTDKWEPHPMNPVIFDPLKARNGGRVHDCSQDFRVYQRQGFDRYGEAAGVAQIQLLSLTDYEEKSLFEVEPKFFHGAKGIHTLNHVEGLMVFDFAQIRRKRK